MIAKLFSRLRASSAAIVAASAIADDLVAAAAIDAVSGAEPVNRVLLLPMGDIVLRDGRGPFRLDGVAHAEAVVAASRARAGRTDLAIDYDHQSYYGAGPGKGGRAPAAGWIKGLSVDAAGIWGDVEWTPAADAALRAREYRYISPLFAADKAGRVTVLRNAGLVNDPAIEALPAVAAARELAALNNANLETPVEMTKIAAALGLEATATVDDILAAIAAMSLGKPEMMAAAAALGLAETATGDEIVAAASSLVAAAATPDQTQWVPAATHAAATARLAVLESAHRESIIAAATAEGRLTPAMAAVARDHLTDPAAFEAYIAAAAVVVPPGTLPRGQAGGAAGDDLVAASANYIAEQAVKGIKVDAASAVRRVISTRS